MKTWALAVLMGLTLGARAPAQEVMSLTPMPEGNTGIASRFPGDVGIDGDPQVLMADGFEDSSVANDLRVKWNAAVHHDSQIRIAREPANVHGGLKSLELTVPQQDTELANSLSRHVTPERDVLFLRYYSKFEAGFDQVGSSHNGASISAHYFVDGNATPGVPANGTNKFLACFENWRPDSATEKPGHLNIYIYHPEQYSGFGDHFFPSGTVLPNSYARSGAATFGSEFVARPDIVPVLDRWYCFEYMLKANTVGLRDGRIACWLDGALIADFPNLRLRDIDSLKIDRFGIGLHIGNNVLRQNKKWYDDVVAATSYIGPKIFTAPVEIPGSGGGSSSGGCGATNASSMIGFLVFSVVILAWRRK